ncbi:MAG: rod shape-determining protein RodA [Deltaproteobacteria bacterium]|nr:rod shape-determining protein RodA [Deltaproteobacteria bacterium]
MRVGASGWWNQVPWVVVLTTLGICGLGIWNLASASRPPAHAFWINQSVYLGVALVAGIVAAAVDYRHLRQLAIPVYVLNILALLALKKFGHTAKGAESWIALGPVRIQPAEFMKIGVILMLARFYDADYRPEDDRYGFLRLLRPALLALVPAVLVLVQPDLGTFMMISLSSLTVILFGRVRWWVWAVGIAAVLLVSFVIWNDYVRDGGKAPTTYLRHHLKKHQDGRISGWLDPDADPRGTNYHAIQSRIAVGSGGLTGKGWRSGTQTGFSFLPERHTDFIFSVLAEEEGFLVSLLLLVLYGVLLLSILQVAYHSKDRFGAFVAVGVAAMLFWQIFENIGMVVGLLPVTGITLPLMSYGGSSLVSVMLGLGLVVNVGIRRHAF